jgi:hypothetical protein
MILYQFPHVQKGAFRPEYDLIPWRNDENDYNFLKTHTSTVLEKPLQKVGVTVNPTQIIYYTDDSNN